MLFVCGLGEVCGPALTITLEWSESLNDVDLTVTEPDDTLVRFSNMVGVSKSLNGVLSFVGESPLFRRSLEVED